MKAEFIAHIQKHKVVPLEELAAAFGLRVPAVVARVKALEVRGGGRVRLRQTMTRRVCVRGGCAAKHGVAHGVQISGSSF